MNTMKYFRLFILGVISSCYFLVASQASAIPCNGVNDTRTCGTGICESVKLPLVTCWDFFGAKWNCDTQYVDATPPAFECSNSCSTGTAATATRRSCSSNQTCNTAGLCVNNPPPPPPPPCVPNWHNLWCGLGIFK